VTLITLGASGVEKIANGLGGYSYKPRG